MRLLTRAWLPRPMGRLLWGDREKWGLRVRRQDACWLAWQEKYTAFYLANQRAGIGTRVNDAGYRVMGGIDLSGRTVLEIGPGDIRHVEFWNGRPETYILADINESMLARGQQRLKRCDVHSQSILTHRDQDLPLSDGSVDIVVSFYSLEHVYPLQPYLEEVGRVLRPGGRLVGAVPAEGGLAWGLGRFLTSRRWLKRHTDIDPDKIICWEHPNFGDEIIEALDSKFVRETVSWWPSRLPLLDANLVIRFVYTKP